MRVDALMTREPITIPRDARCVRAELEMRLAEVRHLPVVDREGRLVGILSLRDLQRRARPAEREALNVDEIMHDAVHTVRPDADAAEAAALLIEKKIGALPVVDSAYHLIGIVTETDFLNVAFQALRGLPLRGRGTPS
jgi:CBS domain-containing protein